MRHSHLIAVLSTCFILFSGTTRADTMTVAELVSGMKDEIRQLASEKACYDEYRRFVEKHRFKELDYFRYLKSKIAFEVSRDAGLWHIAYEITDRQPNSTHIWAQWQQTQKPIPPITAYAECDEVSALYAVLGRQLGVDRIGLFWPQSNHTVAVWTVEGKRIVVPTTPIFLSRHDGFDAKGFDPGTQAVIYEYTAQDVSLKDRLPRSLGQFFLSQIRHYGGASQELLHELRYLREATWYGEAPKEELATLSRRFRTSADRRAIQAFARQFRLR